MYKKPNIFFYRLTQFICFFFSFFIFKRKVLRNEIKEATGPYVVIANHECALDFINLVGLSKRPMTFVISNSFYSTLPIRRILDKLSVIPKQQFQTTRANLRAIKAVIDSGNPLVIYPAGLMTEDGLSTPIPQGTYKFLKWLGVPVYMAKITGSYFVMPKWSKGLNPGKTLIDIYKIFDENEIKNLSVHEIRIRTKKELLFNAYKEQEKLKFNYKRKGEISGLEPVLYMCPNCMKEFTIYSKNKNTLICSSCNYKVYSDNLYLLHRISPFGPDIKYVSDWNKMILNKVNSDILENPNFELNEKTKILMINPKSHKFKEVGFGTIKLNKDKIEIDGIINGKKELISLESSSYPTLPFSPNRYFEIQDKDIIYRLTLDRPNMVMKYINVLKRSYRIQNNINEELE